MTWSVPEMRANTKRMLAAGEITALNASWLDAAADFCERHDVRPVGGTVDLWGFGEAEAAFAPADGDKGWWIYLASLAEPTGLTWSQLRAAYDEEVAMGYGDAGEFTIARADGTTDTLELVAHSAVIRIFMGRSIWAKEFQDNLFDLFRHAALNSGLADAVGPVTRIDEAGNINETEMTFGDWLRGQDLSDEETARARAFSGPAGAIDWEG